MSNIPMPSDLPGFLAQAERLILLNALAQYRFNRTKAGQALGLSLRQVRYRMAKLGITRASFREHVAREKTVTSSQLFVTPAQAPNEKCRPIDGYWPS